MEFYILTTDDKDGHENQVFFDLLEAEAYAENWCREHWCGGDGPFPDTWEEAYEEISQGDAGLMWFEVHNNHQADDVIRSAEAQLADISGQVLQMRGMFSDDDGRIGEALGDAARWAYDAGFKAGFQGAST